VSTAPDFDPAAVPVRPAATIMLLEDRPDLQVLLLTRRADSAFVGGMSVFPGGAVDPADAAPEAEAWCRGLGDARASERLGLDSGGLAYFVAAIRETFEEAGVLLAVEAASGESPDYGAPDLAARLAAVRPEVDARRLPIGEAARREGLALAVDRMHYAARWITPQGPPRRYDTRFFVAALPAGSEALHDDREAVHSEWLTPAEALRSVERGERTMMPPTYGMLRVLARFGSAAEAVLAAAAHEDGPDVAARLGGEGENWQVLLPGDADYDRGRDLGMRAWVRLWPEGGS
jgi:8-oxo-dGTP pyrophosphatase MutT (NUDIX family)